MALSRLLQKKFRTAGVKSPSKVAAAAARHFFSGSEKPFEWDDGSDKDIEFTDEDMKELERTIKKFVDAAPDLISRLSKSIAASFVRQLDADWSQYRRGEERRLSTFRNNLEDRWGEGLDGLRLLYNLNLDVGETYVEKLGRSRAKTGIPTRTVLSRLHTRACQVIAEIIVLLENGHADGAIARWRTLSEIITVATVIKDGADELAERYVAHEVVDAKRALDTYRRVYEELGYQAPTKREIASVERNFEQVRSIYGPDFVTPFGWAAKYIGHKSPRFSDLEERAGQALMRSHYKLASYNVHASSRALSYRVGLLDSSAGPVAGATNAGLDEAGQNTAVSAVQLALLLLNPHGSLDDLVLMRAVITIRDRAIDSLISAARVLASDDAGIRRVLKKQFGSEAPDIIWG